MHKIQKLVKRCLAVLLAVTMINISVPQTAVYAQPDEIVQTIPDTEDKETVIGETEREETILADETTEIKQTGEKGGITWTLYTDGQLVVEGDGELLSLGKPVWTSDASSVDGGSSGVNSADVKSLVLKNSGTTSVAGLLNSYSQLQEADLSAFDASKVTDMSDMFVGCSALTSVNLSGLDISSVTDMCRMFGDCISLVDIDLSTVKAGSIEDMSCMFQSCQSLESVNLKGLDLSSVTSISNLFENCRKLTDIDLSGLDLGKVTDLRCLFMGCLGLRSVNLGNLNIQNAKSLYAMFSTCSSLTNVDFSGIKTGSLEDVSLMFGNCSSLTNVDLTDLDTSKVTTMSSLFNDCTSLMQVSLSGLDTSSLRNMSAMFSGCSSLTDIDLTGLNTENVERMSGMFYKCSSLKSVDLSMLNLTNVSEMNELFEGCTSLTDINFGSSVKRKVSMITKMFKSCSSLTNLDLSSFDLDGMSYSYCADELFSGCNNLTEIKTPLNLQPDSVSSYTYVVLPSDLESKWRLPDGSVTEILPRGLSESVTISRRYIAIQLTGEHFVLKNVDGEVLEDNEILGIKGSTEPLTVIIEPEEGYIFRYTTCDSDCTVLLQRGTEPNQYLIYPANTEKGYSRDDKLYIHMTAVESHSLYLNYPSGSDSNILDAIVVNGSSRTEKKPEEVSISNGEKTALYIKPAASSDGDVQVPVVYLVSPDEYGNREPKKIAYQADTESLSDNERNLVKDGYYIFYLGQIYDDSSVSISLKPLKQVQFSTVGFPGDVRIIRYTLDENGKLQEQTCGNPISLEKYEDLYIQVEWSGTEDVAYQWCHPEVTTSPEGFAEEYTLKDTFGTEKKVWKLHIVENIKAAISLVPHRIALTYSEGDVLDLSVTGEYAGLSKDKKAIEVYGGGISSLSFKLSDNSIILDEAYSNSGTVKLQETDGLYTLTFEDIADIRNLSEITLSTRDSQNRYLLSDPELYLNVQLAESFVTYTGKPVEPRVRSVSVCPGGSGKQTRLKENVDYTVSYSNNIQAGTAYVIISAAEDSKRYRGSYTLPFEIQKAALPGICEVLLDLEAEAAAGTTQQIDLSDLFAVDTAYEKGIKPTGFRLDLTDWMFSYGDILRDAPTLEGSVLKCNIWGDANKNSEAAAIVLYGSFDNYEDGKLILNLRLTHKEDVVLSGTGFAADKIYDGTPVIPDISGLSVVTVDGKAPENPEILMQELTRSLEFHYVGVGDTLYDSKEAPTEAGTYKAFVTISAENMDYKMESMEIAGFTIAKRTVEIAADPVNLYIGDTVPTQYSYQAAGEGLAAGDMILQHPTLSCPALNMTQLGDYPILVDLANMRIYNANNKDVTASYSISAKENSLHVILPEPGSYTVIYDLSGHGESIIRSGMEAGSLLTRPIDPEAEGYVFLDWYKDKTLNKKWDFETDIIQSNMTLYAGWSEEVKKDTGLSLYIQEIMDQTYTGKAVKPVIAVYDGDGKTLLKNGRDYSVQYKNNIEADTSVKKFADGEIPTGGIGEKQGNNIDTSEGFNDKLAYVIVTGKGNYTGSVCLNFHIKPADLSPDPDEKGNMPAAGFALKFTDQFEVKANKNGKFVNSLKYNKKALKFGTDYALTVVHAGDGTEVSLTSKGELPLNAGNYLVTISGKGNYTGSLTRELYVAPKENLMKNAKVTYAKTISDVSKDQLAEGIEQTDIQVTINGTLVSPENYTLTYSNNHAVGTATMTLTGQNSYVGSKSVTFKIKGISFKEKEFQTIELKDMVYDGTAKTQNDVKLIPKAGGNALVYGEDYTVSYKGNVKKGKATITFTANPKSGYSGSFKKKFTIKALGLDTQMVGKEGIKEENAKLILTEAMPFHKGGVKPSGKFRLYLKSTGAVLTEGKDYTVKYKDNTAISQGKAYMTIKGKGNYDQTLTVYFDIGNASLYELYEAGEVTITAASVRSRAPREDDYEEESYSEEEEREYKPAITIKDGKKKLVKDVDYKIVGYYNNMQSDVEEVWGINPYAEIRGIGDYSGAYGEDEVITIPLSIYRNSISSSTIYVVYEDDAYTYTGQQIRPENFAVYYGKASDVAKARRNKETDESVLTEEKPDTSDLEPGEEVEYAYGLIRLDQWKPGDGGNYQIVGYGTNVKPGTNAGSVKLQGVGGFAGKATVKFTIVKKQIYVSNMGREE